MLARGRHYQGQLTGAWPRGHSQPRGRPPGAGSLGPKAVDEQQRRRRSGHRVRCRCREGRTRHCRVEAPPPSQARTPVLQLRQVRAAEHHDGRRRAQAAGKGAVTEVGVVDGARASRLPGSVIEARPPPCGWGHVRMLTTYEWPMRKKETPVS
jgi:hypothetical protein